MKDVIEEKVDAMFIILNISQVEVQDQYSEESCAKGDIKKYLEGKNIHSKGGGIIYWIYLAL